ncbi:MAG: gliding motility-associated C-terminal domain-containing protein [Bacteroidota bacterium]
MKRTVLLIVCFIFCVQFSFAQLCTGSLGDPLVNITFGTGAFSPLKPGVTNMQFFYGACPNDGSYTITNTTSGCFNNTWHTLNSDHTGNTGGLFMLINASIPPDDFYVDTVSGLCGNTTFEFAAWVTNVLKPSACNSNGSKPNLTFRIETVTGTVLIKYDTGDIPSTGQPLWKQYGTFFKTPPATNTVVLRITNNSPGGCGNDIALDDITFRPCGPTASATVRNQPSADVTVCQGDPATYILDASSTDGFAGSTIQWQVSTDSGKVWNDIPGAQSVSYTRLATGPGSYQYRIVAAETANFSSVQCRVASSIATIVVQALPVFVPKTFVLGCTSSDLQLQTAMGPGYTYQWSGPNGFSSTISNPLLPKVQYADSGLYQALVTTAAGCRNIDSFNVKIYPGVTASVNPAAVFICEGGSTALSASGGTSYQWIPATGLSNAQISNPIASPLDTTVYKVAVTNQYGCNDSAQTTVNVFQNPIVSAGADKKIFEGESVLLDGSIAGNMNSFYWVPSSFMNNATILTPTVSPTDTITYTLYALPGQGCPAVTDNVFVLVYKKLAVPNAFSPNGDGINDTWVIKGLETYPEAVLRVYSRNGMLMFQSRANSMAWDGTYKGKPLPIATYYYTIDLNAGTAPVSGWVVIFR